METQFALLINALGMNINVCIKDKHVLYSMHFALVTVSDCLACVLLQTRLLRRRPSTLFFDCVLRLSFLLYSVADQVPHRLEIPVPGLAAAVDIPPPVAALADQRVEQANEGQAGQQNLPVNPANAVEVNGSFSSLVAISSVVISPRVVV